MCLHMNYQASFDMTRLTGDNPMQAVAYIGELMVRCKDCMQRFVFKTAPRNHEQGIPDSICASPNGLVLHIPVEPENEPTPTFVLPKKASIN